MSEIRRVFVTGASTGLGRGLANHYARGDDHDELPFLLVALNLSPDVVKTACMTGLAEGWHSESEIEDLGLLRSALVDLAVSATPDLLVSTMTLARKVGMEDALADHLEGVLSQFASVLEDPGQRDKDRIEAAKGLVYIKPGVETRTVLLDQLTVTASPELSNGIFAALKQDAAPKTGRDSSTTMCMNSSRRVP